MSIIEYLLNEDFLTSNKFKSANNEYIEIFKNPTNREIMSILKDNNKYKSVRLASDKDNNLYAWKYNVLHGEMSQFLKIPFVLTFIYENGNTFLLAEESVDEIQKNMNNELEHRISNAIPSILSINVVNDDFDFDNNSYDPYEDEYSDEYSMDYGGDDDYISDINIEPMQSYTTAWKFNQ